MSMNPQFKGRVSIIGTIRSVVDKDGLRGLYAGLVATYIKILPSVALAFAINERLKNWFKVY